MNKGSRLTFFNTLTRQKEVFTPMLEGEVSLYTCGPTVYNFAHIGNLRTYIFEDLLRRTLEFFDYQVKHVMNITDIDDKTIKGANEKGCPLDAFTAPYRASFKEDLAALNITPAHHYPMATEYIEPMIEVIQALVDKNIAYVAADGSVYYGIKNFSRYGCLSHLHLDELQVGASERVTADEYDKENASDFVLWKGYDAERDGQIYWESPFGKGRPGWHLECSVMAIQLLGNTVDIHCGGVDNIFPHHENELAQSEAYTGEQFVRYWLHSEHLLVEGKKMSKSLGNFYTLRDLLEKGYKGSLIRLMLLQTHYRTQLNFTFEELDAVQHALQRLEDFIHRLLEIGVEESAGLVKPVLNKALEHFSAALADDMNISVALAALFDMVREINGLCDQKKVGKEDAKNVIELMRRFDSVLGILSFEKREEVIPQKLQEALEKRIQARQDRDWALADNLRDYIQEQGYIIEDTQEGGPRLKKVDAVD